MVVGKLHGGAFTPKAYTDAEAKKVDSHLDAKEFGKIQLDSAKRTVWLDWFCVEKSSHSWVMQLSW